MKNILLTGKPRTGKTTVIMEVVKRLTLDGVGKPAAPERTGCGGFYTGEIKEGGKRMGFSISTLDGVEGILSHVNIKSPHHVGRYGVNLADLESIAVPSMLEAAENRSLIIIDEIGKMELFSPGFREAVVRCLDNAVPVLGTIMEARNPFTDRIKERPDVKLIGVTPGNRDFLPQELTATVAQWV
jgi:nucleoside-triphosphatase